MRREAAILTWQGVIGVAQGADRIARSVPSLAPCMRANAVERIFDRDPVTVLSITPSNGF
jgi:hypothetical protein